VIQSPAAASRLADAAIDRLERTLPYVGEWLAYQRWREGIPGLQASIYYQGRSRAAFAYGVTNEATGEPVTVRHLFRIASQTKTFTAVAIFQLIEHGELSLDDPLGQHIRELACTPLATVTIRDLLGHAGGVIRDGWNADFDQLIGPAPDELDVLRIARDQGAVLPAKMAFKYSNVGYNLLGIIVARASGSPYHQYVVENIVARLGLADTGPDLDPERLAEFVSGHSGLDLGATRTVLPLVTSRGLAPCGGFFSTAEDLVVYYAAHFAGHGQLLSDASHREQQHPRWSTPRGSGNSHYGLGMQCQEFHGHQLYGHSGGHPGGQASCSMFEPDLGLVVALTTNAMDAPAAKLVLGIYRLIFAALGHGTPLARRSILQHTQTVDDEISPAEAARYTGRFANGSGVLDIVDLGGALVAVPQVRADDPLAMAQRLIPVNVDELLWAGGDGYASLGEHLHYVRAADGSITRLEGRGGLTLWPANTYAAYTGP
jgi:D-alanyl-D-alanine carboxypeptidase